MIAYPLELTEYDNATFMVTCPDLGEVTSFGADEAECLVNGGKAVASRLAGIGDIPPPGVGKCGLNWTCN